MFMTMYNYLKKWTYKLDNYLFIKKYTGYEFVILSVDK